ncbi:MAG TPA: glycosyltransferase family 9 protein [Acidimicrobiales bacterium]|nr:glycosyltransferase family 9 protein [Acidimicrobiales bacterium]
MPATAPLLVVLRALKLGDLLTAVPALRALARAYPEHHRVLAINAGLAPLVELTGAVHEVVDTGELAPLAPELHRADVAVNLHGQGPQSTALLGQTRPRRLVAFGVPGCPQWRPGEHERHRWCRLLGEVGIPADPDDFRLARPAREAPAIARGATVVHPGASTAARRWPAERWAAVAAAEAAAGRPVVVTGSAVERPLAEQVAASADLPAGSVLAGRTDLVDLLAVVGAAERVVCGDTGVAHVATALAVPSVVIFGPTSPAEWGPPASGPHRALWAGHTGDPLADERFPGLLDVSVADVVAALADLSQRCRS